MKKKIYYLSSCSSCMDIIKKHGIDESWEKQDIKKNGITSAQLKEMKSLTGDLETVFSRRAKEYRLRNLKEKSLKESDIADLIMDHYTFLKRPVVIFGDQLVSGSGKKEKEEIARLLD